MANVLLLDDNDLAERALKGILARGGHRCIVVKTTEEAWLAVRNLVKIDLAIVELKLSGENGFQFIQRVRGDAFLKHLPVLVYTAVNHHEVVKKALSLRIQNYLIKPYDDQAVYQELTKALANPWRNLHFEEEKSFCKQMGLKTEDLTRMRDELRVALEVDGPLYRQWAQDHQSARIVERIGVLSENAQAAGVWGVVDELEFLSARALDSSWRTLAGAEDDLNYAARLIYCQIHPEYIPEGLLSEEELKEKEEERERAHWFRADLLMGPVVKRHMVLQQLDNLGAFPVVDSAAAAFLMAADGKTPSLTHLMDLVCRDPGLSAEVLVAANKIEREGMNAVEDPRTAVSLLGNLRLSSIAKAAPIVQERHFRVPPLTWSQFWTFQVAVARVSDFTAKYLEFEGITGAAYTAGLLHDLGKLLLAKLYPLGFAAMLAYSRERHTTIQDAARRYIEMTPQELGHYFATKNGLPSAYGSVMQWVTTPEEATSDIELVASVALARELCLRNHVGICGDVANDASHPLAETAAWRVLRDRVFPSFNLPTFETLGNRLCATLKQELAGRTERVA